MTDREKMLEEALRAWEAWEADVILNNDAWAIDGGFRVTGPFYDRYIELQHQRNVALATTAEPQPSAVEEDEIAAERICWSRGFSRRDRAVDGFAAYCAVVDAIRASGAALSQEAPSVTSDQANQDAYNRGIEDAAKVARDYASKARQRGWVTNPDSAATAADHISAAIRGLALTSQTQEKD